MYVIRHEDGRYVAAPGSKHSYVRALQDARQFATREQAERERCPESETVRDVADCMRHRP